MIHNIQKGWDLGCKQASGNQCPERAVSSRMGERKSVKGKRGRGGRKKEKKKEIYLEQG
jgi:hypothetical protein